MAPGRSQQVRDQQAALGEQQVVHVDLAAVAVRHQHVLQHLVGDVGDRRIDRPARAIGAEQQVQPDQQRQRRRPHRQRHRPGRNLFGKSAIISSSATPPRNACERRLEFRFLPRQRQQSRQAGGHRHFAADLRLDDLVELGRMRRRDNHPVAARAARQQPPDRPWRPSPCAGTRAGRARASRGGCVPRISMSSTLDAPICPCSSSKSGMQRAQALHVARIAHVHRGGERGDARRAAAIRRCAGSPCTV